MAFTVTIEGLDALRRRLAAIPGTVRQTLGPALKTGAEAVATDARGLVPVVTGTLQRSITSSGTGLTYVAGVVGQAAEYAHFVEYGTNRSSARPFMRPAARREEGRVPGRVRTIAAAVAR